MMMAVATRGSDAKTLKNPHENSIVTSDQGRAGATAADTRPVRPAKSFVEECCKKKT